MQHVKRLLSQLAREQGFELFASKQQQKRVESIELVRQAREGNLQELAFNSRPFVLCGLPIRRPPAGTLQHTRRNGRFRLEVTGHPEYGLPFGQDRLVPIWVATLAVRQRSRTVVFRSAAEILEEFDLPRDGPHYRRLVGGFQRIFTSTIYFGTDDSNGRQSVWDCQRFHFFDRLRIWCSRSADEDLVEPKADRNLISLSEAFWREIQDHPIPIDARAVRELTNTAGCLDLYMWLCWRWFAGILAHTELIRQPEFTKQRHQLGGPGMMAEFSQAAPRMAPNRSPVLARLPSGFDRRWFIVERITRNGRQNTAEGRWVKWF